MTMLVQDAHQRGAVVQAVAALEIAEAPVGGQAFEALADPGLRALVAEMLGRAGRVLLRVDTGWISGYDDTIADRLASEGLGVLVPVDRAVLTVVLLRTVAAPRALGRVDNDRWDAGEPTTIDELALHRTLTKTQIRQSVRRLRLAGVLRPGHRAALVPGPQFLRLTQARSQRLWEDLVLACKPDGMLAEVIRRRRTLPSVVATTATTATTTAAPAPPSPPPPAPNPEELA